MIRETISGSVTEWSKFYVPEGARPRSSRRGKSSERKQDNNARDAVKRLARVLNCNFSGGDALVTLTYATEPERAEGERLVKNMLRRLRRRTEKLGEVFRWVLVSSEQGEEGERVRLHHHLVMSGASLRYDGRERRWYLGDRPVEEEWGQGHVDVRTLRAQKDYTPLALYLVRQARREPDEKKWTASRNMKKPIVKERLVVRPGPMKAPQGAVVLHSGEYDIQSGSHYLRFLRGARRDGPEKGGGR